MEHRTAKQGASRIRLPAELRPESVRVIVDSREQNPWDLSPLSTVAGSLDTGDYALADLPGLVAIERKSPGDFLSCCGSERERFERQLQRLRAYPHRLVVVECGWRYLQRGEWRSKITPKSVVGSTLGWMAAGVPFLFAESHERAQEHVSRFLYIVARREWRRLRSMAGAMESGVDNGN